MSPTPLSLAARYAAGVDRRQLDLFLSAFHPSATLAVHQPQAHLIRKRDQFQDLLRNQIEL